MKPCPCGAALALDACCGRWHSGTPAPSAELLMRSRYAAFVLLDEPYLLRTWHPTTRPPRVEFESNLKWLGLKIVAAPAAEGDSATVEFIAHFRIGGSSARRLHERSRFVREQGAWFYVHGVLPGA